MDDAQRCAWSRGTVEHSGDVLPPDFVFRCPDRTYYHWGVTSGASGQPHFVAINTVKIGPNDAKLRYTIAHEFCHARAAEGLESFYWTDEEAADRCAANYGFPNVYFSRTGPEFGTTITRVVDRPVATGSAVLTSAAVIGLVIVVAVLAIVVAFRVRSGGLVRRGL